MLLFSSISIPSAAGFLGRPGIVIILPVRITTKPAPLLNSMSSTCILNFSLHSRFLGSSENEYCVLAIQIGNLPNPNSVIFFIFSSDFSEYSTFSAPYIFLATFSIFSLIESSSDYYEDLNWINEDKMINVEQFFLFTLKFWKTLTFDKLDKYRMLQIGTCYQSCVNDILKNDVFLRENF